jgi:tRNA U34 5-carboxymethylaminomethyl modifying GTPase MnmE/TrmE
VVVYNKKDLTSFQSVKKKWVSQIPNLDQINSFSISCKQNKSDYQMLISLMKFLNKNLLCVDRNLNENYYFFEKSQISIISSMVIDLEMCIKNIKNIEIASEFLSKSLLSLDTLYGKSDVEDRLEVVFNKFCIGK